MLFPVNFQIDFGTVRTVWYVLLTFYLWTRLVYISTHFKQRSRLYFGSFYTHHPIYFSAQYTDERYIRPIIYMSCLSSAHFIQASRLDISDHFMQTSLLYFGQLYKRPVYISIQFIQTSRLSFGPLYKRSVYLSAHYRDMLSIFGSFHTDVSFIFRIIIYEEFEDTKGVIRIRISKQNRQHCLNRGK